MTEPALKRLRSVSEVAEYLGKSAPTVYRLIRSSKLRASKVGGEWRISDQALRDLLEDGINVKIEHYASNEENICPVMRMLMCAMSSSFVSFDLT